MKQTPVACTRLRFFHDEATLNIRNRHNFMEIFETLYIFKHSMLGRICPEKLQL